jgi:hypothetical protein
MYKYLQKVILVIKNNFFVGILKVTDDKNRIRIRQSGSYGSEDPYQYGTKMSWIRNTARKCVWHTIDNGSELSSSLSEGRGAVDQLSFCFLRATAAFWGLPFLLGGAFFGPGRRRPAGSPEESSIKGTRSRDRIQNI